MVRHDSLRVIIAIAASRDLELVQLDFKTAFLNGVIHEEVYIAQPLGYVLPGREPEVCRLNRALYGICQASRIWNQTLHAALLSYGLVQSTADPCVYHRLTADSVLYVAIWVDDGLLVGSSLGIIDEAVHFLNLQFEMTAIPADHFVGIVISRDRKNRKIYLSAPHYIDKIVARFNMSQANPVKIPVDKGASRLSKSMSPVTAEDKAIMFTVPNRQAVGSIMYAALTTRPDISFIAGQIAQQCENPGLDHWKAVKRVLKYLAGTRDYGLCFGGGDSSDNILISYCDADYAGDPDTCRSTSGFVFIFNGTAISWSSRKQPIVALSTMQSEYIAASEACREGVWLRRLLDNLGVRQNGATKLMCDNNSTILLAKNPEAHKGSKHISVTYHYIREQVLEKIVNIMYVNSGEQIADVLTKALDVGSHKKCLKGMGLMKVPNEVV